jgi:5-methylcytosine-specific restriction enzyme subunit McrC
MECPEHSQIELDFLTSDDVNYLMRYHQSHITLKRTANDKWLMRTNSHVGTVKLPSGRRITVTTKVPVNNLLFMVAYTYGLVQFKNQHQYEKRTECDIADVYVHVLLNWLDILLRKGLYKTYLPVEALAPTIKGKYLVGKNLNSNTRFWCQYDDLTFSTQVNQILKATLFHIIKKVPVSNALRQRALTYFRLIHLVEEITLSPKVFRQVEYNRLNHHYQTLIELCELIYSGTSLIDGENGQVFSSFMANMNRIFEQFVLKYLQRELPSEHIKGSKIIRWANFLQEDDYLPAIEPDIYIRGKYLIDTKYFKSPLNERGKLHSAHLYQILTYMQAYKLNGMLLYPQQDIPLKHSYELNGHIISVRTINLSNSIDALKLELSALAEAVTNPNSTLICTKKLQYM